MKNQSRLRRGGTDATSLQLWVGGGGGQRDGKFEENRKSGEAEGAGHRESPTGTRSADCDCCSNMADSCHQHLLLQTTRFLSPHFTALLSPLTRGGCGLLPSQIQLPKRLVKTLQWFMRYFANREAVRDYITLKPYSLHGVTYERRVKKLKLEIKEQVSVKADRRRS